MTQGFQVAAGLLLLSQSSQASNGGISLEQTRVIFSSADNAQTVTVKNSSQRAYLIQARVQNGPDDAAATPFIVTPPLFSLQGKSRQLLRILPQGTTLPTDRESLFYLSVSAVPAQSEPVTAADRLSIGVRFVVKLFHRPEGLVSPASCSLTFTRGANGMKVTNPTAHFQTLGGVTVNGRTVVLDPQSSMVPPFGSIILSLNGPVNNITWQTITDHGGLSAPCQQTGSSS